MPVLSADASGQYNSTTINDDYPFLQHTIEDRSMNKELPDLTGREEIGCSFQEVLYEPVELILVDWFREVEP